MPQYGHVFVFAFAGASISPLHCGHSRTIVGGILRFPYPKGFSTHAQITLVEGELRLSQADKAKQSSRLIDIAAGFFKKEGYKVKAEAVTIEGDSGVEHRFDLIVQKGRDEQVVWIRDWNRTIGVNVIIGLDTASADVKMPNPIMIGEKFSDHAKSYSNRRKITLLTKQKLTTSFR